MIERRNRWYAVWIVAALLAVMLVLAACSSSAGSSPTREATQQPLDPAETRGMVLSDPRPAADFELIDDQGNPFRLSDHQGRVIAMFFGYTHCPDICPLTLMHMRDALEHLGEDAENALFLFVTVDPERDTPEQMHKYVARADEDVVGLTGDREELERVWEAYDIIVEKEPREDGSYLLGHSAQIWLINTDGQLAMVLPPSADGEDLAHDVRWLLEQSS
jgi:protein SCO1